MFFLSFSRAHNIYSYTTSHISLLIPTVLFPVLMTRNGSNVESGNNPETESLPSYTVVSGLPSYEEALEQLKKVKELSGGGDPAKSSSAADSQNYAETVTRLSVADLFQNFKPEGAGSGKNS